MDGSVEHEALPFRSVLRALWKQKFFAAVVWLVGTAVAFAVVRFLPAVYRADAVILVESQRGAVPSSAELLQTWRQQTLSSNRLLELAREFRPYSGDWRKPAESQVVERMRRDIAVTLERGWSPGRPGAFRVAFEAGNPQVVASVTNRLAGLFIEDNSRSRDTQDAAASGFLQKQLEDARKRLEDQEIRLRDFKLKYAGELPQQASTLQAELDRLQVQLQGVQEGANRAQQNRTLAETMLAAAEQARVPVAVETRPPASADPFDETVRKEMERLQKQLDALRLRYTEEHPEIRHTRQLLAKLRNLRQPTAPAASGEPAGSTNQAAARDAERVESLRVQRDSATAQLASFEAERKRIMEAINAARGGISKLPAREQDLIALNRDYEFAKANYQFLQEKSMAAEVTMELDKLRGPESFRVVEPARTPRQPVSPRRNVLYVIGSWFALLLGLTFALWREFRRGVVLGEWELPKEMAILGRVPTIREITAGQSRGSPYV
jgi:polysaccharide chain length determinant protein (PEP-CTERM system associated)